MIFLLLRKCLQMQQNAAENVKLGETDMTRILTGISQRTFVAKKIVFCTEMLGMATRLGSSRNIFYVDLTEHICFLVSTLTSIDNTQGEYCDECSSSILLATSLGDQQSEGYRSAIKSLSEHNRKTRRQRECKGKNVGGERFSTRVAKCRQI